MTIRIKDLFQLIGIAVITCCAVVVCTLFLNYLLDITAYRDAGIRNEWEMVLIDALVRTSVVVSALSGGCLIMAAAVMLAACIKNHIDTHKKELGILKAMGYSDFEIARRFVIFGLPVLAGDAAGFLIAWLLFPIFYETQNSGEIAVNIEMQPHIALYLLLILVPAVVFSLLAVGYAHRKLRQPLLRLLKDGNTGLAGAPGRGRKRVTGFFVWFSAFCFSSLLQMAYAMRELSSELMAFIMLVIGLTLAVTTLLLSLSAVVRGNGKTTALMKALGYSDKERARAVMQGSRIVAYIGFATGTLYQYLLLKIMVMIVFADLDEMPTYRFDALACAVVFVLFILFYEGVLFGCARRLNRTPIRVIMLDE